MCCYGTNTDIEGAEPREFSGDGEVEFVIESLCLVAGTYKWTLPSIGATASHDYHRSLYTIRVTGGSTRPASSDLHIGGRFRAASASRACESHQLANSVATAGVGLAARLRDRGGRAVFTNGVFDLLHPGHVRYLNDARLLGDALIVGINSTVQCEPTKGRSSDHARTRARRTCAALRSVDAVTIFDEETPHALIAAVQPDVLVKGSRLGRRQHRRDAISSRPVAARLRVALAEGFSSTRLIEKVRGAEQ